MKKRNKYTVIWIILACSAVSVHLALSPLPGIMEAIYSRKLFMGIRWVFDHTVVKTELCLALVLMALVAFFLVYELASALLHKAAARRKLLLITGMIIRYASGFVFFFYLLWGFNYARIPLDDWLGLEIDEEYTAKQLELYCELSRMKAKESWELIPYADEDSVVKDFSVSEMEAKVRSSVTELLSRLRYPVASSPAIKQKGASFILEITDAAAIYVPFTGEILINMDDSMAPTPFLLAHELCHGYGIANEGAANFLAYLACENSGDPVIVYSGRMMRLHSATQQLNSLSEQRYFKFMRRQVARLARRLEEFSILEGTQSYYQMNAFIIAYMARMDRLQLLDN